MKIISERISMVNKVNIIVINELHSNFYSLYSLHAS